MTQKELLYLEDAVNHEQNVILYLDDVLSYTENKDLSSFLNSEKKAHESIIKEIFNLMEGFINE